MTLPSSGLISAAMINTELGRSATAPFSMNGAAERALAGRSSGSISFNHFYGKSSGSANIFSWPFSTTWGGSNRNSYSIVFSGTGHATYSYTYPMGGNSGEIGAFLSNYPSPNPNGTFRAVHVSGTVASGTGTTWTPMTSSLSVGLSSSGQTSTFRFECRPSSSTGTGSSVILTIKTTA